MRLPLCKRGNEGDLAGFASVQRLRRNSFRKPESIKQGVDMKWFFDTSKNLLNAGLRLLRNKLAAARCPIAA